MQRFLIALIAIISIPAIVLAAGLPNYEKDGKLSATFSCDSGKTTVHFYMDDKEQWSVMSIHPASGDVLVDFSSSDDNAGFYMKLKGTTEMKKVEHDPWDEKLVEVASEVYVAIHIGGSDCKKK